MSMGTLDKEKTRIIEDEWGESFLRSMRSGMANGEEKLQQNKTQLEYCWEIQRKKDLKLMNSSIRSAGIYEIKEDKIGFPDNEL